jgi:hypothetical protein
MASYTDAITQFNPYVSQLPVEAMVKVGMQKQAQYEQGVQKIQSQIDQVAGLDVLRDVDKNYLQTKLNELGSKLQYVAAGDFSNFQLVNSVSGMTKQISKDENVQNAVSSTAWYRKQAERMKKFDDEGKGNPANTLRFNKGVNNWLSSSKVGETFNTSYITPIDVWGKVKDIAKEVGIDESDVQQLYQTDNQGNQLIDKSTGKPIWNPVMAEKILKGKDASKILKAFQTALTPADYQQLAINGEYEKASYTPEMLKKEVINNSSEQIKFMSNKMEDLKLSLFEENQKNIKDFDKIKSISDQLEYFQNSLHTLESSRDKSLAMVDRDPDAVRGSLYTNDYLYTMSKSLSSQDESTKYSVSPLWTVTMDQNRFNRDIQRDKIADQHWAVEQKRADRKLTLEEAQAEKDRIELFFKYGYGTPPPGYTGTGTMVKEPIPIEGNEESIKNRVEDDYSNGVRDLNETNTKLTLEYFKSVNPKLPNESEDAYVDRLTRAIYKYASGNKKSVDPSSGDINTFTARFATKQLDKWKKDPSQVPVEFQGLVEKQDNLLKDLTIQKNKIEDIKTKAIKQLKEQGINYPTDAEIKKNINEITVALQGPEVSGALDLISKYAPGETIKLSKEDVVDFVNLHPEVWNVFGGSTIDKDQEAKRDQSKKRLMIKFGKNFSKLENKLYDIGTVNDEFGGTKAIPGRVNPLIVKAGDFINNSNYKKLSKAESQLYLDEGMIKQPLSAPVIRGKENKADVNSRISAVVGKYKGNLNETPGFNEEDMQAALLSDEEGVVKITSYPGVGNYSPTKYVLKITNSKNGKTREVTIDNDDYKTIMKVAPPTNLPTPKVISILDHVGTTNMSKIDGPNSNYWGHSSFKNLTGVNYTVTSDLVKDKSDPNKYFMKLYLHYKDGSTEPLVYPEPFYKINPDGSLNQTLDYLPNGINATVIKQLKSKK